MAFQGNLDPATGITPTLVIAYSASATISSTGSTFSTSSYGNPSSRNSQLWVAFETASGATFTCQLQGRLVGCAFFQPIELINQTFGTGATTVVSSSGLYTMKDAGCVEFLPVVTAISGGLAIAVARTTG